MNKTLQFKARINAPRAVVWESMLGDAGYRVWTAPFTEGSYFEGGWNKGDKIKFLAPGGSGMTSVIDDSRRHEFVSIKHLGEIANGVEDTTSDKVRAWAPAYEKYTLREVGGETEVQVDLDTTTEYEKYMTETFPKALDKLKAYAEAHASSVSSR